MKSFMAKDAEDHLLLCRYVSTIDREASKGKLQQHCSGLLDGCSVINILSIKFVLNLLLVSDCCSASILLQLQNILLRNFAYSMDCKPLMHTQYVLYCDERVYLQYILTHPRINNKYGIYSIIHKICLVLIMVKLIHCRINTKCGILSYTTKEIPILPVLISRGLRKVTKGKYITQ